MSQYGINPSKSIQYKVTSIFYITFKIWKIRVLLEESVPIIKLRFLCFSILETYILIKEPSMI